MMRRRSLLGAILALPLAAAGPTDVSAPIKRLNGALIEVMKAGAASPYADRFTTLATAIDQAFDLRAILQTSIGPRWASLPDVQRAELLAVFRRFTVATYLANFDSFSGERFDVLAEQRQVGSDQVVATQLVAGSGPPVRFDYVMRQGADGGWRVVDVLLDGSISRVAVQRSDFRALLADGNASALIGSLQRKIAELSGGAAPA